MKQSFPMSLIWAMFFAFTASSCNQSALILEPRDVPAGSKNMLTPGDSLKIQLHTQVDLRTLLIEQVSYINNNGKVEQVIDTLDARSFIPQKFSPGDTIAAPIYRKKGYLNYCDVKTRARFSSSSIKNGDESDAKTHVEFCDVIFPKADWTTIAEDTFFCVLPPKSPDGKQVVIEFSQPTYTKDAQIAVVPVVGAVFKPFHTQSLANLVYVDGQAVPGSGYRKSFTGNRVTLRFNQIDMSLLHLDECAAFEVQMSGCRKNILIFVLITG